MTTIGRRGALRLGAAAGLGLLGSAGAAATLVQNGVVPGRLPMWEAVDGAVPDLSPRSARGPVETFAFRSRFRRETDTNVLVMTPPGTDLTAPGLPVCLVLHGRGGEAHDAFRMRIPGFLADVVAAGAPPFAAVAVDGGTYYWHARRDGIDTQRVLTDDVLPRLADKGYACGPGDRIATLGWSMGGFGALLLGQTLGPDRVAAVGAMSPAIWHRFEDTRPGAFDDAADFAAHDVFTRRDRMAGIAVRVDCSLGEVFLPAARDYVHGMTPRPSGGFQPGIHNRRYWRRRMPDHLALAGAALGRTPD